MRVKISWSQRERNNDHVLERDEDQQGDHIRDRDYEDEDGISGREIYWELIMTMRGRREQMSCSLRYKGETESRKHKATDDPKDTMTNE